MAKEQPANDVVLSVITPCYNSERFITPCLQNVQQQYTAGIEHLIMDGGSNDGTAETARKFADNHPWVKVFSAKDSGQSDAMNKGILRAKGRFICFLNVDDYFEPNVLPYVITQLKQLSDRHLFVGNCRVVNSDGSLRFLRKPSGCGYPQILEFWRKDVFPSNPSSYFYARHLHDLAGLYDENEHFVLDYEMMIRLLKHAEVKYVDRDLGNFLLHEDTKTHQNSSAGNKITKLRVFNRYKSELPLMQRLRLNLLFYYHMKLMRSNHPVIFFAMRPGYFVKRLAEKLS